MQTEPNSTFTTSFFSHSQRLAATAMSSPYRPTDLFHSTHPLPSRRGRLRAPSTSSSPFVGNVPHSTPPSVGNILPSTPPLQISPSELSTPYSTGYAPTSDSEYSPPMATDLLPGAPQTLDLMILTEYINSMFKQAGNNGSLPSEAQKNSTSDFLLRGRYSREDIETGFLHAVAIMCKARRALEAALEEVTNRKQAIIIEDVVTVPSAKGLRITTHGSTAVLPWEKVDVTTARSLEVWQLHSGILRAYIAVADIKITIVNVYRRHMDAQAKVDAGGDDDGSRDKDGDMMEVDPVVQA